MRALFIDHPEADFLSATTFMGLHEILGENGIVDWPFKKSYHGQLHEYPSIYDFGAGTSPWHSWKKGDDGRAVGTTAPFQWMPALLGREWSEDEVLAALSGHEFDLCILASPRKYNMQDLRRLRNRVGRDKIPPLVFMDGEDYDTLRWDVVAEFGAKLYLKRELLHNPGGTPCRLEAFPFASPVPEMPAVEKDIDVLFAAGKTWAGREEAHRALTAEFGSRIDVGHRPYSEYLQAINRAKIAISVRGWGYDTLRVWEIPSFETMLVADRLPIIRPYPFEHGQTCALFDDVKGLVDGVRCALEDEQWRARIAKAGNDHLRKHHTARARAQQLLDYARA